MDGLPLCGAPAATPWHSDAVEVGPSTPSLRAAGAAIQSRKRILDCFGAKLFAMTSQFLGQLV
jgi:hypothetical protein